MYLTELLKKMSLSLVKENVTKLSGLDQIVEIDESLFGERKGPGRFWRTHLIFLISWCSIDGSDSNLVQKVANSDGSFEKIRRKSILRFFIPRQGRFLVT